MQKSIAFHEHSSFAFLWIRIICISISFLQLTELKQRSKTMKPDITQKSTLCRMPSNILCPNFDKIYELNESRSFYNDNDNRIDRGQQNFFPKGSDIKYFRLIKTSSLECNYSTLPLLHESSHRQIYINSCGCAPINLYLQKQVASLQAVLFHPWYRRP